MPRIPSYTVRKVLPSASSGAALRSTDAARTQQEAIGQSLVPLGRAVENLGVSLEGAKLEEEGRNAEAAMQELLISDMEGQLSMSGAPSDRVTMEPSEANRTGWGDIASGTADFEAFGPQSSNESIAAIQQKAYEGTQPIMAAAIAPVSPQFPDVKTDYRQRAMQIYNGLSRRGKQTFGHSLLLQVGNHRLKSLSRAASDQSAWVKQQMPQWAVQVASGDPTTRNYVWANTIARNIPNANPAQIAVWNATFESAKAKVDMASGFSAASSVANSAERASAQKEVFDSIMEDPHFVGPAATQEARYDAITQMKETGVEDALIDKYIATIKDPTDRADANKKKREIERNKSAVAYQGERERIASVKKEMARENPDGTLAHSESERDAAFKELRNEIQTSTTMTADQATKTLTALNQWEKTLTARAGQVSLKNTINYYRENTQRLFNNEMALEELDEVKFYDDQGSKTGSTERDWSDYIGGAADVALNPVEFDSREGISSVMNAVLNNSMKSINAKTAMDNIYAPALLEKNVTRATAEWALKMIEEPFPSAFAEDLKGVIDANYDIQRTIFKGRIKEDAEASAINRSLMIWAGENSTKTTDKDGNDVWNTPSLEQLEDQSAQYRAIVRRDGVGALGGIAPSDQDAELEELGMADEVMAPLTAEEYNAVPSGVWYQHPDDPEGELRKKP